MKKIFFLTLLLSTSYQCFAQPTDNPMKSMLDSTVHKFTTDYFNQGKRVAVSIGVSYNGQSYTYNYGETSPGSGILPTDKSTYEIGSITKTFTGLLIAHAVTAGKIALNDDVRKFLPGNFPNLQYPNGDPVKIAYLLAHTAQFPNSFGDVLNAPMNNESFINALHKIKLDSLKSFRYNYSNVGYQLLGMVLENIYQQTYESLVMKYITNPLGMQQTKLTYTGKEINLLLKGHGAMKEQVNPILPTLSGAGGLHSSIKDMIKYLNYQNMERTPEVKLTHRVIFGDVDREAYGFQWAIGKNWSWDQYLRIDGGTQGFRSFCVLYPLHQISIVILTNQKDDNAGIGLYKLATGIYGTAKKLTKD